MTAHRFKVGDKVYDILGAHIPGRVVKRLTVHDDEGDTLAYEVRWPGGHVVLVPEYTLAAESEYRVDEAESE